MTTFDASKLALYSLNRILVRFEYKEHNRNDKMQVTAFIEQDFDTF